jgi:transposase InsO family protein
MRIFPFSKRRTDSCGRCDAVAPVLPTTRAIKPQQFRFANEVIKRLPFRVLVIQTDNGAEFQSRLHWHLESLDIRHVYFRPRTPHLNGNVERSHRVDAQEFYQLLDKHGIADDIHLFNDKLREWEDYYNYHRPQGALDGQTPYERLLTKTAASMSPAS